MKNHIQPRIGDDLSLVFAIDSGCLSYDAFWLTTSLRGVLGAYLTVRVLKEGVHSGEASGVVPSSFRIIRTLLDRIEDSKTGEFLLSDFNVVVPENRYAEMAHTASLFP